MFDLVQYANDLLRSTAQSITDATEEPERDDEVTA